jgi:HKD family nuclease
MIHLQNPAQTDAVLSAIRGTTSPDTIDFRAAVAYVTHSGASLLLETLSEATGPAWPGIQKSLVTCFDFGSTEPDALTLMSNHGFEVRVANVSTSHILVAPVSSYHPKAYFGGLPDGTARAAIGSANLSRRALTVNTEVVASSTVMMAEVDALWSELNRTSVPLTAELLAAYVEQRPAHSAIPQPPEPAIQPLPLATGLGTFRQAVESGLDPSGYEAFWVEVGGPSGGSSSQLELPRRAQRFFGFAFTDYGDEHHTIGTLTLSVKNVGAWGRDLTWHGNNKMERMNLPTTNMCGLTYSHRVVLFRRLAGGAFEIAVAEPDSTRASRWRNEATAAGLIFRFGPNSPRRCGLL